MSTILNLSRLSTIAPQNSSGPIAASTKTPDMPAKELLGFRLAVGLLLPSVALGVGNHGFGMCFGVVARCGG